MKECRFYENINGNVGECRSQPPVKVDSISWSYPIVDKGCCCRFYSVDLPIIEVNGEVENIFTEEETKHLKEFLMNSNGAKLPTTTKRKTTREKLLAKKKAEQEKNSDS